MAGVTVSIRGNLVITASEFSSAAFLLKHREVINSVIPIKSIEESEAWAKIAVHGVPTQDLRNMLRGDFAKWITKEVSNFNTGLRVIGDPYWLSSEEKRFQSRAGSIVLAFKTKEEAQRAISKRLTIAGVSCKAELLKPRKTSHGSRI